MTIQSRGYKKCFVAFIDILGFKEMIKKEDAKKISSKLEQLLTDAKGIFGDKYVGAQEDFGNRMPCKVILMSDTLLIFTQDDSTKSFGTLIGGIGGLVQLGITNQVRFRGAISWGDFYSNDELMHYFGKAYIDACDLEKKQEWIGVILTEECERFIKENPDYNRDVEIEVSGRYKITGPLLVKYAVPLKECISEENTCNKKYFERLAFCVNWTIGFTFKFILEQLVVEQKSNYLRDTRPEYNNKEVRWTQILAKLPYMVPHEKSVEKFKPTKGSKEIKKKYENTIKFLEHCKRFEKKVLM